MQQFSRYVGYTSAPTQPLDQHIEFVAIHAGELVAMPQSCPQVVGDFAQDMVSCIVSEPVIDRLEMIEINEENSVSIG